MDDQAGSGSGAAKANAQQGDEVTQGLHLCPAENFLRWKGTRSPWTTQQQPGSSRLWVRPETQSRTGACNDLHRGCISSCTASFAKPSCTGMALLTTSPGCAPKLRDTATPTGDRNLQRRPKEVLHATPNSARNSRKPPQFAPSSATLLHQSLCEATLCRLLLASSSFSRRTCFCL